MKVLVVDDNPMARKVLVIPLQKYASSVDQAEDGVQAVRMVEQALSDNTPYNLVCLDIQMTEKDGIETLREIRSIENRLAENKPCIIFMITASSSPDDMMEALQSGSCDDFLTKPVLIKNLTGLMQKHGLI